MTPLLAWEFFTPLESHGGDIRLSWCGYDSHRRTTHRKYNKTLVLSMDTRLLTQSLCVEIHATLPDGMGVVHAVAAAPMKACLDHCE